MNFFSFSLLLWKISKAIVCNCQFSLNMPNWRSASTPFSDPLARLLQATTDRDSAGPFAHYQPKLEWQKNTVSSVSNMNGINSSGFSNPYLKRVSRSPSRLSTSDNLVFQNQSNPFKDASIKQPAKGFLKKNFETSPRISKGSSISIASSPSSSWSHETKTAAVRSTPENTSNVYDQTSDEIKFYNSAKRESTPITSRNFNTLDNFGRSMTPSTSSNFGTSSSSITLLEPNNQSFSTVSSRSDEPNILHTFRKPTVSNTTASSILSSNPYLPGSSSIYRIKNNSRDPKTLNVNGNSSNSIPLSNMQTNRTTTIKNTIFSPSDYEDFRSNALATLEDEYVALSGRPRSIAGPFSTTSWNAISLQPENVPSISGSYSIPREINTRFFTSRTSAEYQSATDDSKISHSNQGYKTKQTEGLGSNTMPSTPTASTKTNSTHTTQRQYSNAQSGQISIDPIANSSSNFSNALPKSSSGSTLGRHTSVFNDNDHKEFDNGRNQSTGQLMSIKREEATSNGTGYWDFLNYFPDVKLTILPGNASHIYDRSDEEAERTQISSRVPMLNSTEFYVSPQSSNILGVSFKVPIELETIDGTKPRIVETRTFADENDPTVKEFLRKSQTGKSGNKESAQDKTSKQTPAYDSHESATTTPAEQNFDSKKLSGTSDSGTNKAHDTITPMHRKRNNMRGKDATSTVGNTENGNASGKTYDMGNDGVDHLQKHTKVNGNQVHMASDELPFGQTTKTKNDSLKTELNTLASERSDVVNVDRELKDNAYENEHYEAFPRENKEDKSETTQRTEEIVKEYFVGSEMPHEIVNAKIRRAQSETLSSAPGTPTLPSSFPVILPPLSGTRPPPGNNHVMPNRSTYLYGPSYDPYSDPVVYDDEDTPYTTYMWSTDPFPDPYSTHTRTENYGMLYTNRYYKDVRIPLTVPSEENIKHMEEREEAKKYQIEQDKDYPVHGVITNTNDPPRHGIIITDRKYPKAHM